MTPRLVTPRLVRLTVGFVHRLPSRRAAAAGALLLAGLAPAQGTSTRTTQPPSQPAGSQTAPASPAAPAQPGVVFAPEPLRIESIGMTMQVPEDAEIESESMGSRAAVTIRPAGEGAPAYEITIRSITVSNPQLTAKQAVDSAAQDLADRVSVLDDQGRPLSARAVLVSRDPAEGQRLTIPNAGTPLDIERFYMELPGERTGQIIVRGVTMAKISANQFVVWELFTSRENFPRSRAIFETLLATASFDNPALASAERGTLVSAGQRLLERYDASRLEDLARSQTERWERLYRPARSGRRADDEEVGYRRVSVAMGPRRLVGGGRGMEAEQVGIIVQIDARALSDGRIIDTQSRFFMTPDRADEAWTIGMTIREGENSIRYRETGVRLGTEMSVRIESPDGGAPKTITPTIAGEGYISRVESYLLPQMIVREGLATLFGFYAYQSQQETISFRRDALERDPTREGVWKLTTRLVEGQPESVAYYRDSGELISLQLPGGILQEPSTRDDLVSLWRSKGLPLD